MDQEVVTFTLQYVFCPLEVIDSVLIAEQRSNYLDVLFGVLLNRIGILKEKLTVRIYLTD